MKDFRKLEIWKEGIERTVLAYHLANSLPDYEKFGLCTQIRRSARSIPANISEGSSRSSQVEYRRFLDVAWGSANELETDLTVLRRIELGNAEMIEELLLKVQSIQRRINTLIQRISKDMHQSETK